MSNSNTSARTSGRFVAPALRCFAASSFVSLLAPVAAAQDAARLPMLEPVQVTSSRFSGEAFFPTPGATVITAQEIREAGAASVGDALSRIGGIPSRNLTGGPDRALDLRGFGPASDNNIVVLVDGIRLSENEQLPAITSSIPIESVERIEIVRGGSSVLYGEGATGGTIRIITRRPQTNEVRGTLAGEIGSFNTRDLRASVARDWNGLSLDVNLQNQRSDNYRANNQLKQENLSTGLQYRTRDLRLGFRIERMEQDTRFPGAIATVTDFEANPRAATTPNDFGSQALTRYTAFAERKLGNWELAFDASQRDRTLNSRFVSFGSTSLDQSRVSQFSPRVRHLHGAGEVKNEFTAGMDFSNWSRSTNRASLFAPSAAVASQDARALYLRDELQLGKWRLAAGVRHESFNKDFVDPQATFTATAYSVRQSLRAWELQAVYALSQRVETWAKAGQSYRIPNVDENGFTTTLNRPLRPQRSKDLEAGVSFSRAGTRMAAKVFQHRLTDEIQFNPAANLFGGANDNLDPTRRRGIELDARMPVARAFVASASLQHVQADFTAGPNAGREVVLVPRNTATLRLNWLPGGPHSASAGLQWVDRQRFGNDFDNTCARTIPSHATLDARYAYRSGGWETALSASNLANRQYYSNGFSCGGGLYPEAGRQLRLLVRRDF